MVAHINGYYIIILLTIKNDLFFNMGKSFVSSLLQSIMKYINKLEYQYLILFIINTIKRF